MRDGVKDADAQQPIFGVDRMPDVVARAFGARRLTMVLLLFFATVSIAPATIGLYGVVSFGVQQRTHEIGVRLAVGASAAEIVRMVVATGVRLGAAGVMLGVAVAVLAQRLLAAQLFEIAPLDGWLIAAAAALLTLTAGVTWIPARRASRIDPLIALRTDA